MKNLQIKSKLLGLLFMFIASIFVTSCEQSEVILDNDFTETNSDIITYPSVVIDPDIVEYTNIIIDREIVTFTLVDPFESVPEVLCNLPKSGTLDVSLYNAEEQHVRTIYKADVTKGAYQISIDKERLPRGIYFVHASFISTDRRGKVESPQISK